MRKIAILLISFMVINIGFLSGCTDESGGNKFVGTWTATSNVPVTHFDILKIYKDGLASLIYHTLSSGDGTDAANWSVDTETKTLTFNLTSLNGEYKYNYNFPNDETLVLTRISGSTSITYKKS
jgi:hypothetical protein